MSLEGRITIDILSGQGEASVDIASSRPLTISRRFGGLRPEEVVRMVSLLFGACKAAQTAAAIAAFEDALGIEPGPETRLARRLLVCAETVREHALRVVIDWPKFLSGNDEPPPAAAVKALMRIDRELGRALDEGGGAMRLGGAAEAGPDRLAAVLTPLLAQLQSFLETHIFGEDLADWRLRRSPEDLTRWAREDGAPAQRLVRRLLDEGCWSAGATGLSPLPQLDRATLAARLFAADSEAFIAAPDWEGAARETTPLARNHGHPLIRALAPGESHGLGARLITCLIELSQGILAMQGLASEPDREQIDGPPRDGAAQFGLAQIDAARGRLVHAVRMEGEKTGSYRILAPTEWNFHPQGAAARGVAAIAKSAAADRDRLVKLFIMAVDPCVGVDVTFR